MSMSYEPAEVNLEARTEAAAAQPGPAMQDELPPFDPPETFEFPMALRGPMPRPIPPEVRNSSDARRKRQLIWNAGFIALSALLISKLPAVTTFSAYFLPLAYLDWLALATLAVVVVLWMLHQFGWEGIRIVRDGEPLVGRVVDVDTLPVGTAEAPEFAFTVDIEFAPPGERELLRSTWRSRALGKLSDARRYAILLERGQYTTLVRTSDGLYHLYGGLGFDSTCELILVDGKPPEVIGHLKLGLRIALIMAGVGVLLTLVAMCISRSPGGSSGDLFTILVCLVVLGAVLAIPVWKKALSGTGTRSIRPILAAAGVAIFLAAPPALVIANAELDKSPARLSEVEVLGFWQQTYKAVFRTYEIEVTGIPMGLKQKIAISYDAMSSFADTHVAVTEFGDGWLGMPWCRGVHPVEVRPLEPGESFSGATLPIEFTEDDGSITKASLALEARDSRGNNITLSPAAVAKIKQRMSADAPAGVRFL
jgi:hypothetical protein